MTDCHPSRRAGVDLAGPAYLDHRNEVLMEVQVQNENEPVPQHNEIGSLEEVRTTLAED